MPKAILKNGVIQPVEPLPAEWRDGKALTVEPASDDDEHDATSEEIERDFRMLNELCAQGDAEEDERMMQAMAESKRVAKEWMRKHMGLS